MHHRSSACLANHGAGHSFLIFALGAFLLISAAQAAQEPDPESSLRARMSGFWDAMQKEDYATASRFVHPASRDYFIYKVPRARMGDWKIQKLEFNADKTACNTVTVVNKPLAFFSAKVDWPMRHEWLMHQGEWYLKIPTDGGETAISSLFRGEMETAVQTRGLQRPASEKPAEPGQPATAALTAGQMLGIAQRLTPDPANPKEMHFGEKGIFRYQYKNEGNSPIKIISAFSDCHCTGLSQDFPEIAPGQTGTLEVSLDTFGLPLGRIEKDISVQFSDLANPITVRITVPNLPNFAITPAMVDFGRIEIGKIAEKTLRIANQSGKTVKFSPYLGTESKLALSMEKTTLEPGEAMIVTLRYEADRVGEILGSVMFRSDLPAEPLLSVRIFGKAGP